MRNYLIVFHQLLKILVHDLFTLVPIAFLMEPKEITGKKIILLQQILVCWAEALMGDRAFCASKM